MSLAWERRSATLLNSIWVTGQAFCACSEGAPGNLRMSSRARRREHADSIDLLLHAQTVG